MIKIKFCICIAAFVIMLSQNAYAESPRLSTDWTDISQYDFNEIQDILDNSGLNSDIQFKSIVMDMITEGPGNVFKKITENIKNVLLDEINANKNNVIKIIIIAIVSALFTSFTGVFTKDQVSETGFFISYMLLITILIGSFVVVSKVAADVVTLVIGFMCALIPTYFLAVGVVSGNVTVIAFYQIVLASITVINVVFIKIIIPGIGIYVSLMLINNITKEDFISKLADLIKTLITWSLKVMFAAVIGINVIQSLITPMADSVKTSMLQKVLSFIPGVGSATGTISKAFIGSGMIVKNGIGVAALVIIVIICLVPLMKLLVFSIMYQFAAAVVQPISDKRIVNSIDSVFTGTKLLFQVVLTTVVLFMITIAIICLSTNATYLAL